MHTSRKPILSLLLFVSLVIGGCVGPTSGPGPLVLPPGADPQPAPHVVVAVFDTGINPYHPVFRTPGAPEPRVMVPTIGDYATINLSFDLPYPDAFAKDGLDSLERQKLYWFRDTRILAYSNDEQAADHKYAAIDEAGHGTGTASLVARASPNAYILAIESVSQTDVTFPWAEKQPWIDVFSISLGVAANAPVELAGDFGRTESLRNASDSGKMIIVAAGNEFVPPTASPYGGPPWVITVGGASSDTHGETIMAAKTPDIVSDFMLRIADDATTENLYHWATGTSFGAPLIAGVVAQAIYEVRTTLNYSDGLRGGAIAKNDTLKITAADVRSAINETATYWETADYQAPSQTECPTCLAVSGTLPVAPTLDGTTVGPWVQMGWGYVDEKSIAQIVANVLGHGPGAAKPEAAVEYMNQLHAARESYWALPIHSGRLQSS
ncbi:MAG: S8/S53 family peptidase [Euryarchaeota archaeon]|nr:S8/S53 family peptidase [Euryarchaeota archaeon]